MKKFKPKSLLDLSTFDWIYEHQELEHPNYKGLKPLEVKSNFITLLIKIETFNTIENEEEYQRLV